MIWEIDETPKAIEGLDADGRPDPAYAAALGLKNAPLGRRSLAYVCDVIVYSLVQLPFLILSLPLLMKFVAGTITPYGFLNHPTFVIAVVGAGITVALSLALTIVQWVLHGTKGVTIGKAIAGIRSINVRTLAKPGLGAVLLRFLIVAASGIVPVIGPIVMLASPTFDGERGRGWHDKLTGVWLVDVRNGLQPYHEKRMRVARKTVAAEPAPERTALPSLSTPGALGTPAYRPGDRISAGVLGVSRSMDAAARPTDAAPAATSLRGTPAATPPPSLPADLPGAPPAAPASTASAGNASAVPSSSSSGTPVAGVVDGVPGMLRRDRPAQGRLVAGLLFDTGDWVPVTATIVLGRNPDAESHPSASLVRLTDESRSLSKGHLMAYPVDGGLGVQDLSSTNGSAIVRGGVEYELEPGSPMTAIIGDRLRIGSRMADVVTRNEGSA